jgi:protocatechuate 3,4-dioxygenase beta subunit
MAGALILLPILGLNFIGCNRAAVANKPEVPPSWNARIVSDTEPGEPLIISGTIYSPDGKQPMEGITLFVYQTDATGVYTTSGGDNRGTRIHGVMRTGADGRYQFRTIKPGSYPNSRNPAHIHAYVSGPGYPEYWIDEYHFADDPYISAEDKARAGSRGSFSPILKLERGTDGILRAVRDIKIERCTNNCTGR